MLFRICFLKTFDWFLAPKILRKNLEKTQLSGKLDIGECNRFKKIPIRDRMLSLVRIEDSVWSQTGIKGHLWYFQPGPQFDWVMGSEKTFSGHNLRSFPTYANRFNLPGDYFWAAGFLELGWKAFLLAPTISPLLLTGPKVYSSTKSLRSTF